MKKRKEKRKREKKKIKFAQLIIQYTLIKRK